MISQALTHRSLISRLLVGLVFGFVVLLVLLFIGDARQVSQQVAAFRWVLMPVVMGLTLLNYILRFVKWDFYLKLIGIQDYPKRKSARLFTAGFPLAVTPGKVGEALKAIWLNRETGVSIAAGVAVVLAERVSDGLAVLALSTLGVIAYPQYWPAFAAVLTVLLGVVVISQIRPLAIWLLEFAGNLPLVGRFAHSLSEFYEGSYLLFKPKPTLLASGLGTISWLGEGIGFYLILIGLGVAPGWEMLANAVFILAFSIVIGAASTLPGGIGASEATIAGMLTLVVGLDASTAAAATLLIRLATLWFGASIGLTVWAFSPELFRLSDPLESPPILSSPANSDQDI